MSSTQLEVPSRELPASEEYTVPDQEAVISLNGGRRVLHPSFTPTTASSFCVQWDDINTDDWWTHHPEYTTTHENATHTCFSYIKNDATRLFYQRLHDNQFFGNCSVTQTRHMWSSGWGSDMSNLVYGLLKGLEDQTPFAVGFLAYKPWWHYAANKKDASNATCPQKDISCYFLHLTNCKAAQRRQINQKPQDPKKGSAAEQYWDVTYNYLTRSQQWLRKAIQ